jgi:hypothetical protein
MPIKIQLVNGKVPESCMKLLIDLAGHRDVCDQCFKAYANKTANWCVTGFMILEELGKQPEVSSV